MLFRVYQDTPNCHVELPPEKIHNVAERLFLNLDIPSLNSLYFDLVNQGTPSTAFSFPMLLT